MSWFKGQRFFKRTLPAFQCLPRLGENQIERKIFESGFLSRMDGLPGLDRIVNPPQKTQFIIVKTLDANTQAVDSGRAESAKRISVDGAGICFEGDFNVF